jgi:hypothetical protein
MTIPLIDKDDVISRSGKKEKSEIDKEKGETRRASFDKKRPEKLIRVLRIKYYSRIMFPFMDNEKVGQKEAFAVDRSLDSLLKALYHNTGIQGNIAPPDCIFVEKDDRMSSNDKFIFVNIDTNEFYTLKRQLENHTTIVAFNKGEFSILDGKISSLSDMYRMPRIWKGTDTYRRDISDTNIILMREKLREELKDELCPYHSYTDDQIDNMKESELIALKKLSSRKKAIENKKRKKARKLLR